MKNIFTTIEHVATKITEAITGHKSDPQAHPTLTQQINVLSKDGYIMVSNLTSGTVLEYVNSLKNQGYKSFVFKCNRNTVISDAPTSQWSDIRVTCIDEWAYLEAFSQISNTHYKGAILTGDVPTWRVNWETIATTTKTEILWQGTQSTIGVINLTKSTTDAIKLVVSVKKTNEWIENIEISNGEGVTFGSGGVGGWVATYQGAIKYYVYLATFDIKTLPADTQITKIVGVYK